jgi:hypothetical protein
MPDVLSPITAAGDAVTKAYADGKVAKTGDTMTGNLGVVGAADIGVYLDSPPASTALVSMSSAGSNRWILVKTGTAGDLVFNSYDDAGAYRASPIYVVRSSSEVLLAKDPSQPLGAATKKYVDDQVAAGGGGGDVMWVGPSAPVEPTTELWYDEDEPVSAVLTEATADVRYVNVTGDTLTGPLTLAADPVAPLQAVPKQYVDSSVGTSFGFRNVIRNGDMSVAQRGDGPHNTVGYTLDGWYTDSNTGTPALTRVVQPLGYGSALLRWSIADQSGVTAHAVLNHFIEDVATLAGQQVTLSLTGFVGSGTAQVGVEIQQYFGSSGPTPVFTTVGSLSLTTTASRPSLTFTVPSVVGKTRGGGNDSLRLLLWFSAGSNYAARSASTPIQNNVFSITDVQLEAGPRATTFERLPQQVQLAWNQRYFQRWTQPPLRGVVESSNQAGRMAMTLPVTMRATPAVTFMGPLMLYDGFNSSNQVVSITYNYSTPNTVECNFSHGAGLTGGRPALIYQTGTGYLNVNAEL